MPETLGTREVKPPLLGVSGVEVRYGAIQALRGVSLSVGQGDVVALIGANGAGKTSTLRAVSGMLKPTAGTVQLAGQDITGQPAHTLVGKGMAHAPEGRGIFPNLTVLENLELGAYLRSDKAGIAQDLERMYGFFPVLRERQAQLAGTLSGGEQQMLAISRALMSRPKLLLLDEPSLGLAPQVTQTIFRILREVNAQGVSILLVEQNAHLALGLAHWAYVLETGAIVMEGTGQALLASDDVRKAYLGE
ncbi:MAG: ABC transporter ATP-binding protein [Myxococcaceae bacterium]|nr:ABC transporter ATP-binding protein [Myxococcaceae bacterium]